MHLSYNELVGRGASTKRVTSKPVAQNEAVAEKAMTTKPKATKKVAKVAPEDTIAAELAELDELDTSVDEAEETGVNEVPTPGKPTRMHYEPSALHQMAVQDGYAKIALQIARVLRAHEVAYEKAGAPEGGAGRIQASLRDIVVRLKPFTTQNLDLSDLRDVISGAVNERGEAMLEALSRLAHECDRYAEVRVHYQ